MTKNQVIAFVVSICICLLFLLFGLPDVTRMFAWAGSTVIDTLAFFSFQNRFASISKGVLDSRDVIFFVSLIAFWLFANTLVIERKKAN
jgi:ABC-2 type transport system permease protein